MGNGNPTQFDPLQEQLNRATVAVVDLMAREMDQEFLYLTHGPETTQPFVQRTAQAANRIVVACRRLADEIRPYERYDRWRREDLADKQLSQPDDDLDDVPF